MIKCFYTCEVCSHNWVTYWGKTVPQDERLDWCERCDKEGRRDYSWDKSELPHFYEESR